MNLNFIRKLTMRAKTEGVEESTVALKGLQTAYDGVAKSQLSLADALERAERRFNAALKNTEKVL